MGEKVTVFGSFVVDLMARAPKLPRPAETVKGTLFRQGAGGKGFNQGNAAKKAGADIAMVTKVGEDALSLVATDAMKAVGLPETCLFRSADAPTGVALILVDEGTGQNEIVIVPGACATITDEDVDGAADVIRASRYLLLQLEVNAEANERAARIAKESGVRVIVNTAPYAPVSDEFLRGCWLVTPNEVEAEALTGVPVTDADSCRRAAAVFRSRGVENVVITLGGRGAYLLCDGFDGILPAFSVNAVDTTGAGDAMNGGLLAGLSEGMTLPEAVRFGQAVAALSVQKLGTTPSMPWRREVDAFLAEREEI